MHFNAINIKGKKFGRLVAISPTNKRDGSNIVWKCRCDCGKIVYVNTVNIKNTTNSCGCLRREILKSRLKDNNPNYKYGRKEVSRRAKLKALYGITLEQYNEMLLKQNNQCAICHKYNTALQKPLFVDHDHKTGKVRGLLCTKCNFMLGAIQDSVNILKYAIKYLKERN